MNDTPSEQIAAVAGSAVENVVIASEAAIDAANVRADAAEEVAALLTEAAIQRSISERVDDVEEDIETWQSRVEVLEGAIQNLTAALPTLVTLELLRTEIAALRIPSPQSPTPAPSLTPEAQPELTPENKSASPQQGPVGDGPQVQAPENHPKRYRLT